MIRVESITIKEFRGIRDLTLDFKEKTFAICGPNGTGKSGVVDALEFALTGNVSRLSGEGRGEVNLKQHGPHVDRRNDPDKARVTVRVTIPSLGKVVAIERSLKNPVAQVTPADPEVLEVLRQVEAHPEIVLSRRELIRYVLATPGKRSEEVQALLHLDQVGQVRVGLQKIANTCEKQLGPLVTSVEQTRENLLRALGISEMRKEKVLAASNAQRVSLGLPALTDLLETTSLKDGLATPIPAQPQRIPKVQALANIRGTRESLAEVSGNDSMKRVVEVTVDLNALIGDPAILSSLKRESLFATGLELVESGACPLCDNLWDPGELKKHIQAKISHLKDVSEKRTAVEKKIAPLIATLHKAQAAINTVVGYASLLTPSLAMNAALDYGLHCRRAAERLTALLPLPETITVLTKVPLVPQNILEDIKELEQRIAGLPEPTQQDAARDWLAVAQERLENWRDAMRKHKAAEEQTQKARQISDIYAATSDKVLGKIYTDVENDFSSLYGFINREGEGMFKA
ncbi:MAG: DUF2813 domain-containing protein [Chrysiogenales bacterium]|nr:MAG: DUF2813 domain-containing protein [Chrysiogenales bacterium]